MGFANGQVPASALRTINSDASVLSPVFNAYKALVLLGHVLGWTIKPANGIGSGYRSLALQGLYYKADHGDKTAAQQVGLSATSTASVARPGFSTHGWGDRIDLVFNGSDNPSQDHLALANHLGFVRDIAGDRNHFHHDLKTAISGPSTADWFRIKANYYNGLRLGETTDTVNDGRVDFTKRQNYTWLAQAHGHTIGLYPFPAYKHDGIWGPQTNKCDQHVQSQLWNSIP